MKKIAFIPNKGARLGHQFVEWLRGYILCKNNGYLFYHHKFLENSKNMDDILNLSYEENLFKDYIGSVIRSNQMSLNEYLSSNVDDLYVYDFFIPSNFIELGDINEEIRNILRKKYFSNNEKIMDNSISVHIRRDDVFKNSPHWGNRYIDIEYFMNILKKLYQDYPSFQIKIFSSNVDESFYQIKDLPYKDISFHVNEDIKTTLKHMINSKILITSSSGLSFIASIISDDSNLKICPNNFWHKWPKECIINNHEL